MVKFLIVFSLLVLVASIAYWLLNQSEGRKRRKSRNSAQPRPHTKSRFGKTYRKAKALEADSLLKNKRTKHAAKTEEKSEREADQVESASEENTESDTDWQTQEVDAEANGSEKQDQNRRASPTPIDASRAPHLTPSQPEDTALLKGSDLPSSDFNGKSYESLSDCLFDDVRIHEQAWERIQPHRKLRSRLDTLIRLVEYFYASDQRIHDSTIRKVDDAHYKIRLLEGLRIPFSFHEAKSGDEVTLIFWEVLSHEEGEAIHETGYQAPDLSKTHPLPDDWGIKELEIEENDASSRDHPYAPLYRVWRPADQKRLEADAKADLRWKLSPEQEEYCHQAGPLLLKGSAGSGKTTIALYRLLSLAGHENVDNQLYVTYTNYLRDHSERLFQQLADPGADKLPTFLTIDSLCRNLVADDEEQFPKDRKFTYDAFKAIPALRQTSLPIPLDLLWEEIRGVIKGAFQIVDADSDTLTLDAYRQIPTKQSLVPVKHRRSVYDVFTRYQQWLDERGFWDDLDLARTAHRSAKKIRRRGKLKQFDNLVVDEVQDLTTFHVQLVLALSGNPYGLFLTGDTQQVIHPSRFEWRRIKEQLYHHTGRLQDDNVYFGEHVKEVQEVAKNFRSTKAIVNLSNRISQWRNDELQEFNSTLDWVREGPPLCWLSPRPASEWTDNEHFSHRLMVIVPSEEVKSEAQAEFGKGCVYTVHEAKGLEADFVILWRFFSGGEIWQNLHRARQRETSEVRQQFRYQASLFNVAVTRARDQLFFLETDIPFDWQPIEEESLTTGETADIYLHEVLELRSRAEDYYELARDLEARDLLEQAAANYFDAGYDSDAYRCLAIRAERREAYEQAGDYYERADLPAKAIRCFEKSEVYQKAFELMLSADESADIPSIKDYLDNDKKLAKLEGEVTVSVVQAILNEHPDVSVSTLFDYSRRRLGLNRYEIGRAVDNMRRTRLRDLRQAGEKLESAVIQLSVRN